MSKLQVLVLCGVIAVLVVAPLGIALFWPRRDTPPTNKQGSLSKGWTGPK